MIREFDLTNELRWKACQQFIDMNWEALKPTNPLRVIVTTAEETRRNQQNRYYFGGVLKQIAEQAMIAGVQYSQDAWHEFFADRYCPHVEVMLPGGESRAIRKSTTKMTVKEFAEYTEQVTAHAAQLGVIFYLPEET